MEPDTSGPCAWHPCIYERRSATYHGRGTDGTRISHGFYRVLEDKRHGRVKESGILIQDVETKNIMTKSTLPVEAIPSILMWAVPMAANTATPRL